MTREPSNVLFRRGLTETGWTRATPFEPERWVHRAMEYSWSLGDALRLQREREQGTPQAKRIFEDDQAPHAAERAPEGRPTP